MSNDNNESWWDNHRQYLWQAMGKENFDIEDKLTDEDWMLFVQHYADEFAERAAQVAEYLWIQFRGENPEIEHKLG